MIAEATSSAPANGGGLPVNWFDLVVVAVLLFGLFRGKRNGMSKELLPLLQWLAVVLVSGFGYPSLGKIFSRYAGLDRFWGVVLAYLALAVAVFFIFSLLRHRWAEKLAQSSFFKDGEYYLGMLSGMVRYACALVFVLALLNARVYTPEEIAAAEASDKKDLGGGLFQGNYIPHLFQIQSAVFKESFLGSLLKPNLERLLIVTVPTEGSPQNGGAPGKKPVIQFGNPPATGAEFSNAPAK